MSKINFGYCGICERQIWTLDKINVPNEYYCEISLSFSNDTVARHGICSVCAGQLTDEKVQALFERIKESWISSLEGSVSPKRLNRWKSVTLKVWDQSEQQCREKHDKLMKEEHEQKLEAVKLEQQEKDKKNKEKKK